ncbi:Hpt domain-containing protein [Bordetella petrii]|uniref:Hpt domain-containing protein n=1 Tax=Bordetella petrii TaxID=94624 RepID=UPI001A96E9CA|nr:Hpt domain-containing protein [Bordetella petrii]MBO1114243.1 Hpt domain-containing protein [Bordetella petrii]
MTLSPDATAAYASMQQRFRQRIVTESQTLHQTLQALRKEGPAWSGHDAMRRLAHQLAGLGGTFGFDAVSEASVRLEDTLIAPAGQYDRQAIETAAQDLLQAMDQATGILR